jgi:hypothetical protein
VGNPVMATADRWPKRIAIVGGLLFIFALIVGLTPVRVPDDSCGKPFAPGWTETVEIGRECTAAMHDRWQVILMAGVGSAVLLLVAVLTRFVQMRRVRMVEAP